MIDEKLVKELLDLEDRIDTIKHNIANKNFYPNTSPDAEGAAKMDLNMYQYRYKKAIMDLTDEDKVELAKLAEEKGYKLKLLKKLKFTKAEKESCKKMQDFLNSPLDPELNKLLDDQNWGK